MATCNQPCKLILVLCVALFGSIFGARTGLGFCGFYVAKADTKLFNESSKVVLVRDENRTVVTMANDYQGDPAEFAIVIPVPEVLARKQINVGENKVIDHLDAYTAPRLVEYFDSDPCDTIRYKRKSAPAPTSAGSGMADGAASEKSLGVTVEATYEVGEYDILILSAKESSGLQIWLNKNGYKTPNAARKILKTYIKSGLKFFVAKVALDRKEKEGLSTLRPLQIAYESNRFELPVRLGTVNAKKDQELFVFALTRKGRVEAANYRTVKLPTGQEIPVFVKDKFADFYKSMFEQQVAKENKAVVFQEYAWDMSWCDPCAADPLSAQELKSLGVYWVNERDRVSDVFVTRLHARYNAKTFPEDLKFQVTTDRNNFQGRYILRHPYKGKAECKEAEQYRKQVVDRQEKEAQTLASLTGWDITDIRRKMKIKGKKEGGSWIDDLWK